MATLEFEMDRSPIEEDARRQMITLHKEHNVANKTELFSQVYIFHLLKNECGSF